jgi:two-component system sensor kinase FixL
MKDAAAPLWTQPSLQADVSAELFALWDAMPSAIITLDHADNIQFFSRGAAQMLGYAPQDMVGTPITALLPHFGQSDDVARTQNGQEIPAEISLIEANVGNSSVRMICLRSLRDQVAAEAKMAELSEQLLHASRVSALGEVGAGLAHELNQPLAAAANFLGAAEIGVERAADPSATLHLIKLANEQVSRAGEMIRRMRNFMARGERDLRSLKLGDLVEDALQLTRPRARQAGVDLQYTPCDPALMVMVDQLPVQQVLVNIINNSLDILAVTPSEQPHIHISAIAQPDGQVLIRVEDNGPGFADGMIDKPFAAFVSSRTNGLGIGLSICRRVIEGHGSRLYVGNGPHGGAHIEFTLPIYTRLERLEPSAQGCH